MAGAYVCSPPRPAARPIVLGVPLCCSTMAHHFVATNTDLGRRGLDKGGGTASKPDPLATLTKHSNTHNRNKPPLITKKGGKTIRHSPSLPLGPGHTGPRSQANALLVHPQVFHTQTVHSHGGHEQTYVGLRNLRLYAGGSAQPCRPLFRMNNSGWRVTGGGWRVPDGRWKE